MTISLKTLGGYVGRDSRQDAQSRSAARQMGKKVAFLCHSHNDRHLVKALIPYFRDRGISIYIDWLDETMPASPNVETAGKIKDKIDSCDFFLFLATENSKTSRWCPWEIGYCDGKWGRDKVSIIPTESHSFTYGNEYLQLYKRLVIADDGSLAMFEPNQTRGGRYASDFFR
jgi:hypothetical protein